MVCFQCGSPISTHASACPNCGAVQRTVGKRLNEGGSQGLRRMTMELKAIDISGQLFPPGEIIAGRFRLGEMIGDGPFGQVFKAHDTLADTDVALKVFTPDVLRNPMDQERFMNATRSARALTQRNVVRLHDSGVHKDHAWISMQHLEGLSLRKLLDLRKVKGEGFSLEEIEPIIGQITLALQHIGREHPHGSLKPENIIFLPDFLKVTDSYVFSALSKDVFRNRLKNSPYLAPELRLGTDDFDARCDVYSVGQIIGEMYYGNVDSSCAPFRNDALDMLYARATAEAPSGRYASVEELAEDLGTLLDTGMLLQMRAHGVSVPAPPGAPDAGISMRSSVHASTKAPGPPAPPAQSVDSSDSLTITEEDIETIEVRRDADNKPVIANHPELGDLLATIEADRSQKSPPISIPDQLEIRHDSGHVDTVVAVAEPSLAQKTTSRTPLLIAAIAGLIVLALIIMISLKKPDSEVVSLGDGTASATDELIDGDKPGASSPESKESTELNQAMLAANDAVLGSTLSKSEAAAAEAAAQSAKDETAESQANDEKVAENDATAENATEPTPNVAVSGDDSKGARSSDSSAQPAAAIGAPSREPVAKPPVAKDPPPKSSNTPAAKSSNTPAAKSSNTPAAKVEETKVATGTGLDCPSGMVLLKSKQGNFCVDAYEYPGKGSVPKTNTSWFDARKQCMSQGKRLCGLSEWKQACGSKYPYGASFNPDSCNTADEDGFERSVAKAGSFSKCRSRSGTYDMSGNLHEWVEEQRVAGGGYDSDETVASCSYSSPKAAGSSSRTIGFRCCSDAQ